MGPVPIAGETKDEKVVPPDGDGGGTGFGAYRDDGALGVREIGGGAGGDHGVWGSEVSAFME